MPSQPTRTRRTKTNRRGRRVHRAAAAWTRPVAVTAAQSAAGLKALIEWAAQHRSKKTA